jgi:hypothetical protein
MKQPIPGIAGLKPRAPKPEGNGKLSKEESRALDREYRVQRNQALQLKNHRETMLLAKARGELIEKRLVQLQASFLLTAHRRAAMALQQAYCDRLAAAGDPLEVKTILDEAMRGLLTEVADLPNRIDAAAWEKFLAAHDTTDDGSPPESEEKPAKTKTPRRRLPGHRVTSHDHAASGS